MNDNEWMYHNPDGWTKILDDQENAQTWAHQQQLEEQQMAFEHKEGRGSGWSTRSDNPKAPKLNGSMKWKGETINWAIWKNDKKKDTDPDWGIKLEEPREQSYTAGPKAGSFVPEPKRERTWNKPEKDDEFPF